MLQEAEQKQLELEMQKRRERIEQWRAARKPKVEDLTPIQIAPASRKWTLEDEDEEEEKAAEVEEAETENGECEEEVDPLDAYMQVFCLHVPFDSSSSISGNEHYHVSCLLLSHSGELKQ